MMMKTISTMKMIQTFRKVGMAWMMMMKMETTT